MLNEEDVQWLAEHYQGLTVTPEGISGTVDIKATYNLETNLFLNIKKNTSDDVGGVRLSGSFKINIRERSIKPFSKLPALRIENIEPIPDRHINISDDSACLCSPLVEDEYLIPLFNFKSFFEKLVIPFLYGQLFYIQNGSWPWHDYSHGSMGLLESYVKVSNPQKGEECLQLLKRDKYWEKNIKPLLFSKEIKGHRPCICNTGNQIRRCHPEAWKGLILLKKNLNDQGVELN
jgi:hypothetical protein